MTAQLDRVTFSVSRAADFLDARALESQTGQPRSRFGSVVVKELIDNSLDACESAGVAPEITVTVTQDGDGQRITVEDNAAGIPAAVVTRILDYSTLTSDKALYRSPCRGAQGNALKTIIGIPHSLGVTRPVVITAQGVRHEITVGLDLAGNVKVDHDPQLAPAHETGTSVSVPLPAGLASHATQWVRQYAVVNPHATFTVSDQGHDTDPGDPEIYKPAGHDRFRKPVPTDPTSAHWYDPDAFTRLIGSLIAAGDNRPLGKFIREFHGLTGSAKARQIAAAVPAVTRLSDFTTRPAAAEALLGRMKDASTPPKPAILGQVPKDHYEDMLDQMYGVDRFWYRHGSVMHDGIAWHIEAAIADTLDEGGVMFAVNYAPAFGDPLGGTGLEVAEVWAEGAHSFLSACDAAPDGGNGYQRAAVIHVTCAAPAPLDKGKVRLVVPGDVADAFAAVLWGACRELHREAQTAERDADRRRRRSEAEQQRTRDAASKADRAEAASRRREERERDRERRAKRITVRDAVFQVIPEAIRQQREGSDLPFSAHSLFYKIRPLALRLLPEGTRIRASYVEQTLIPEWEREHGPIRGMYRKPRGTLHEPHGGGEVPLGTREVEAYTPPAWSYDKVLVVEKDGLWPVIEAARIAEKYDMAIIMSEGYGAEACRRLLARMPPGDVRIFALHDADIDGYNIARTLGEATARMPDHSVDVADLGLTVDAAIAAGLEPEEFTRERAIPAAVLPRLSSAALEWFTGEISRRDNAGQPTEWLCRRVELNAFTSPGLIAYIEDGLERHDATAKLVPPRPVLRHRLRSVYEAAVQAEVEEIVARLADVSSITRDVKRIARRRASRTVGRGVVRERLESRREDSWRDVVGLEATSQLRKSGADLERLVAGMLKARLDEAL